MIPVLTPETSISELPGVGPKVQAALERLGISTIQQLIEYLPRRLEDRSQTRTINQLRIDEEVVLEVMIKSVSSRKSKKGTLIIQVNGEDVTGKIPVLWFNQRYLLRYLQPGQTLRVFGAKKIAPTLGNPFFVKTIVTEAAIVPIYRSTATLSQAIMRKLIHTATSAIVEVPALLPEDASNKKTLLVACHADPSEAKLEAAKTLLAREELLLLGVALNQITAKEQLVGPKIKVDEKFLKTIVSNLPYQLTEGQRKAAWEIISDVAAGTPMRRVMYGEVGSGKTIIALLVAAAVIRGGQKVAMLVPTTTLAEQQARVAKVIFGAQNLSVAMVIGERKENHAEADLIIGTQALLQKQLRMPEIGLVIIDEQQRLGVNDRQHLIEANPAAHMLMMTATPIPRSLAHIIFGQMKLTYLRGKPVHQKAITTMVFDENNRAVIETEIEGRICRGEPGYVICPLIESDDEIVEDLFSVERKAVAKEAKRLKERFPNFTITPLHGRLKGDEKTKILRKFRAGEIDILVSTTVVEVGIDNPNATWILVEEADCFGLASLHQLRGRVGRGELQSVCFLAKRAGITELGVKRLDAVATTTDGLELAEADLQLRGPGELIGVEQSGLPNLRYANWQDLDLVKKMFARAEKIVQDGVDKYPAIQKALEKFETIQIS